MFDLHGCEEITVTAGGETLTLPAEQFFLMGAQGMTLPGGPAMRYKARKWLEAALPYLTLDDYLEYSGLRSPVFIKAVGCAQSTLAKYRSGALKTPNRLLKKAQEIAIITHAAIHEELRLSDLAYIQAFREAVEEVEGRAVPACVDDDEAEVSHE